MNPTEKQEKLNIISQIIVEAPDSIVAAKRIIRAFSVRDKKFACKADRLAFNNRHKLDILFKAKKETKNLTPEATQEWFQRQITKYHDERNSKNNNVRATSHS